MAKRKTRRERRTFNAEYKQQVLELVRADDKSVSQICRDLDLTESSVRKWIKADQTTNGTMTQNSLSETDQQELERLRTENRRLKTERDILKKATVSSTGHCNTFKSFDDNKGARNEKTKRDNDSSRPQNYLAGMARW